jgi:hypothetical protein
MKISINPFDRKSITEAIKLINQYKKDFVDKEREFIRRLTEIGVSVATVGFSTADYDGENDVLVTETQNGNRAAVIAYGETVGFIEFGTGVRFDEYDSSTTEFKPPAHGTYGKGRGANPKGWYFKPNAGVAGRHTYGNAPAEAMLTARDTMVERIVQVAREVWK